MLKEIKRVPMYRSILFPKENIGIVDKSMQTEPPRQNMRETIRVCIISSRLSKNIIGMADNATTAMPK